MSLVVRFNGVEIHRSEPDSTPQIITHEFDDVSAHLLEFEMQGKLSEHTEIDSQGNIVQDRVIEITDFALGGITVDPVLYQLASYLHSYNSSAPATEHKFYGTIGCNGVVKFKFACPVHVWLLDHV